MGKSTTEARRHGGKRNHVLAVPRFDHEPVEQLIRCVTPLDKDNHERNSLVEVFSVSPCLRGGFSASCKENPRP